MPTIPTTMRAAAIDKFGDPEVLKLRTLPVPIPDPSEVLIEVDTAGVGPWDADIRGGWSPGGHIKFPSVLGYEGSGRVMSLGSHIQRQEQNNQAKLTLPCTKSLISLCNLCVLRVSVVDFRTIPNHGGTEDTEVAQRRNSPPAK